jgi:hypothetical protein
MPPRGEGRPFIPPAELRGILAYFDKGQGFEGTGGKSHSLIKLKLLSISDVDIE